MDPTHLPQRRWCLTLNNYSMEEYLSLTMLSEAIYAVIGKEVGESGTPHLQGFFIWPNSRRLSAMRKLSPRAHWEPTKGTSKQAADYCKKEGDFVEIGDLPRSPGDSQKHRWEIAYANAKSGDFDEIPADIRFRYYSTCKHIAKDHLAAVPDALNVTGVWIWGAPGVGKSRKARADYPDAYPKLQNKWWDGYQGQEYVILDDFDMDSLGHHLKIWADRYGFIAETKGGALRIRPRIFCITSNYSPDDPHFKWDDVTRAAIRRRFHVIEMIDFASI